MTRVHPGDAVPGASPTLIAEAIAVLRRKRSPNAKLALLQILARYGWRST